MPNSITTVASTPDPTFGQSPGQQQPDSPPPSTPPSPTLDSADLRLVIEEDKASGSYIYKTVNRITGEVVLQLPREQLLKLQDDAAYMAGDVIRAKARSRLT